MAFTTCKHKMGFLGVPDFFFVPSSYISELSDLNLKVNSKHCRYCHPHPHQGSTRNAGFLSEIRRQTEQ